MRIVDPNTGKSYVEKRLVRYDEPGQPRALTFSCYHRFAFLSRDRSRQWLCAALAEARTAFGFHLWAYVIMPEHVHVLVYPGDAADKVGAFLQAVKEPVGRQAVRYVKDHAPDWLPRMTVREGKRIRRRFWQPGSGYDRNITSIETLRAEIEYMHATPLRRGLVARAEDWEWSSARWYAGLRPVKLEMDANVLVEWARG